MLSHGFRPGSGFIQYRWDSYSEASLLYLPSARPLTPSRQEVGTAGSAFGSATANGHLSAVVRSSRTSLLMPGSTSGTFTIAMVWTFSGIPSSPPMLIAISASACGMSFQALAPTSGALPLPTAPVAIWPGAVRPSRDLYNGTLVPCAATGSLMLAPQICLPVLREMLSQYGDSVYGRYGFADAFNPHWQSAGLWVDPDVVGIDIGISLLSIDNLQNGYTWKLFMQDPNVKLGLRRAGFLKGPGRLLPGLAAKICRGPQQRLSVGCLERYFTGSSIWNSRSFS